MKRILIILITFLTVNNSFSQEYYKFPTSSAIWNHIITGSLSPPYEWLVIDSLGQETTIGNYQYVEIYRSKFGNSNIIGAIREDTLEKKIYFHNFNDEIVLYDFNLDVGDTIFYSTNFWYYLDYYKVVNNIDSIFVCGQYRKRWHLTNSLYYFPDTWIEGIGSVYRYGLMYPNDPDIIMDASTPYFGCFTHDTITYIDSNNCCSGDCPCTYWLVRIKEVDKKDDDVRLFPNPVQNILTIDFRDDDFQYDYFELYSYNAMLIQRFEIDSKKMEINLKKLNNGIYFIKLTGKNKTTLKKIIKK